MAKDVRIVPGDGTIIFNNAAGTGSGKLELSGDDLVFSNAVGDVLFGDTDSDVYIGDGVSNVDIVFEQNGSIRGEDGSSVTLTLGSPDTTLELTGSITHNGIPAIGIQEPTTLTKDGSNIFRINLTDNINFILSASGAYTFDVSVANKNVGQSGNFIIKNISTTTPGALPSNLKTPGGRDIAWQTDNGDTSIISYIVVNPATVLINYIGDFG